MHSPAAGTADATARRTDGALRSGPRPPPPDGRERRTWDLGAAALLAAAVLSVVLSIAAWWWARPDGGAPSRPSAAAPLHLALEPCATVTLL